MSEFDLVRAAWVEAGTELGIAVETSVELRPAGVSYLVFVRHFGRSSGTVVFLMGPPSAPTSAEAIVAAEESGYTYSFVSADSYGRFDAEHFKDTLRDWGYYGPPETRPSWL